MLQLGLKYANDIYGARKVSLGVFENNTAAYHCYKAVGFKDVILDAAKSYHILGGDWKCLVLELILNESITPNLSS